MEWRYGSGGVVIGGRWCVGVIDEVDGDTRPSPCPPAHPHNHYPSAHPPPPPRPAWHTFPGSYHHHQPSLLCVIPAALCRTRHSRRAAAPACALRACCAHARAYLPLRPATAWMGRCTAPRLPTCLAIPPSTYLPLPATYCYTLATVCHLWMRCLTGLFSFSTTRSRLADCLHRTARFTHSLPHAAILHPPSTFRLLPRLSPAASACYTTHLYASFSSVPLRTTPFPTFPSAFVSYRREHYSLLRVCAHRFRACAAHLSACLPLPPLAVPHHPTTLAPPRRSLLSLCPAILLPRMISGTLFVHLSSYVLRAARCITCCLPRAFIL